MARYVNFNFHVKLAVFPYLLKLQNLSNLLISNEFVGFIGMGADNYIYLIEQSRIIGHENSAS